MIIDLRDLHDAQGHLTAVDATTVEDPVGGETLVPCTIDVDYRQSGGAFYFRATVEGTLGTSCQRCLVPVRHALRGEFELVVRRGEQAGDDWGDVLVLPLHRHDVELDPFIRETVVVNTPIVIVCNDDCRGLCPTCGVNLNFERCGCEAPGDARWDALKKL